MTTRPEHWMDRSHHEPYTIPATKMGARESGWVQGACSACPYRSSPTPSAEKALRAARMHADARNGVTL